MEAGEGWGGLLVFVLPDFQISQSRYSLQTLDPNVGLACIPGALGLGVRVQGLGVMGGGDALGVRALGTQGPLSASAPQQK